MQTEMRATIKNSNGIHLRPAVMISELASGFSSRIRLIKESENTEADAKSTIDILGLGLNSGDSICVRALGPDSREAAKQVKEMMENITD